jgi:ribA/ribD-fused uncharacterized protein
MSTHPIPNSIPSRNPLTFTWDQNQLGVKQSPASKPPQQGALRRKFDRRDYALITALYEQNAGVDPDVASSLGASLRKPATDDRLAFIEKHLRPTVGEDKAVMAVVKWTLEKFPKLCGPRLEHQMDLALRTAFLGVGPEFEKVSTAVSHALKLYANDIPRAQPADPTRVQQDTSGTQKRTTRPERTKTPPTVITREPTQPVKTASTPVPRAANKRRQLVPVDKQLSAIANEFLKANIPQGRVKVYMSIVKSALLTATPGANVAHTSATLDLDAIRAKFLHAKETGHLPRGASLEEMTKPIHAALRPGTRSIHGKSANGFRSMERQMLVGGTRFSDDDTGKAFRAFWDEHDAFSNYAETPFQMRMEGESKPVQYRFGEQAFQEAKVRLVMNESTRLGKTADVTKCRELITLIRNADSAKKARNFAKAVHTMEGFGVDDQYGKLWGRKKTDVMQAVVRAKFEKNDELKKMLLDTGDDVLVEASKFDNDWGVGLGAEDSRLADSDNWGVTTTPDQGERKKPDRDGGNQLGNILMELRKELKLKP